MVRESGPVASRRGQRSVDNYLSTPHSKGEGLIRGFKKGALMKVILSTHKKHNEKNSLFHQFLSSTSLQFTSVKSPLSIPEPQ